MGFFHLFLPSSLHYMTTFLRRLGPERTWPASNMASCNQVLLQSHLFAAVSPFFARLALEGDQTWHRTTSRVQCTHIWRGGQNYANTSMENKTNAIKNVHKYTKLIALGHNINVKKVKTLEMALKPHLILFFFKQWQPVLKQQLNHQSSK